MSQPILDNPKLPSGIDPNSRSALLYKYGICGAPTKTRPPGVCQRPATANSGKCRHHSGKAITSKRIEMPVRDAKRPGRVDRYLPTRLLERYREALNDPDLLAMRDEIAVLDARLADLLKRSDSGESAELWKRAQSVFGRFIKANRDGNMNEVAASLSELQKIIERGNDEYAMWRDIRELIEDRRRLVGAERQRLVEMQHLMNADQAMFVASSLAEVVRRHVTDPEILRAISEDLSRILQRPTLAATSGSVGLEYTC